MTLLQCTGQEGISENLAYMLYAQSAHVTPLDTLVSKYILAKTYTALNFMRPFLIEQHSLSSFKIMRRVDTLVF